MMAEVKYKASYARHDCPDLPTLEMSSILVGKPSPPHSIVDEFWAGEWVVETAMIECSYNSLIIMEDVFMSDVLAPCQAFTSIIGVRYISTGPYNNARHAMLQSILQRTEIAQLIPSR